MADILQRIVESRIKDINKSGVAFGFNLPAERKRAVHPFLKSKGVILEVKRASPSKGDIAPDLDSGETAASYAQSGAAAISCLTETNFFKGTLQDLMNVCDAVDEYERSTGKTGPAVLRKDFLLSEEEIDVAYKAGADAVLLISRILTKEKMASMAERAASYGMTSLVEIRLDEDIEKLAYVTNRVSVEFIACGVNSRDLATFTIDLLRPCSMLNKIRSVLGPYARVIFESGIRSVQSAELVSGMGFAGLLLGEAAAKNPSIRKSLVDAFVNARPSANADFWKKYALTLSEESSGPSVKICGLTSLQDAKAAYEKGASFAGFIFYSKSKRSVDPSKAEKILNEFSPASFCVKAGVIVNPDDEEARTAIDLCRRGLLDVLQLHTMDCARKFLADENLKKLPHYAAVNISSMEDVKLLDELFELGECRVLIDASVPGAVGGTGKQIEADLIKAAQKKYPLWLAGGITPDNVREIAEGFSPELIDIASGVEECPGKKDPARLSLLFENLA